MAEPPGASTPAAQGPLLHSAFGSPFEGPDTAPSASSASLQRQAHGSSSEAGERAAPAATSSSLSTNTSSQRSSVQKSLSIRISRRSSPFSLSDSPSSPSKPAVPPPRRIQEEVWGWLQPGRPSLPYVLLQGQGAILGRGRDAFDERLLPQIMQGVPGSFKPGSPTRLAAGLRPTSSQTSLPEALLTAAAGSSAGTGSSSSAGASQTQEHLRVGSSVSSGGSGAGAAGSRQAVFVEIPDGRISRLHCWIGRDLSKGGQVYVEDVSSNGTFLNGEKIQRNQRIPLKEGDKVSLVLSVAPLAEQAFLFRKGDPRTKDAETVAEWIEDAARMWAPEPAAGRAGTPTRVKAEEPSNPAYRRAPSRLRRSSTSSYTTAEALSSDDLQCTICLCTLRDAVALEPCGHSYCAHCLSHHFAALLSSGQPLSCPLRCAAPERVVANTIIRGLVRARALQSSSMRRRQGSGSQLLSLSPVPESLGSENSLSNITSQGGEGTGACYWLQSPSEADSWAAVAGHGRPPSCPPMPLWLQMRLAEGLENVAVVEPHIAEVAAILLSSGHLPQPDEDGAVELDLRRLDSATLWALCEIVLGPVMAQNELAAAVAATAVRRAVARLQAAPTEAAPTVAGEGQLGQLDRAASTSTTSSPFAALSTSSSAPPPGLQSVLSLGVQASGAFSAPADLASAPTFNSAYSSALAALEAAAAAAAQPLAGWAGGSADLDEMAHMHPLCPLYDELLPLDAGSLKNRQLALGVQQLQGAASAAEATAALEAMARLAWSDDAAREELARLDGVEAILGSMEEHIDDEAVQCTGALALMSLVRGDGETSAANKRQLAEAGGIETVVSALQGHPEAAMVQLSCMLSLVPLALEGACMQARIAELAVPDILSAAERHAEEPEVVAKALVLLGVLAQGEEPLHDQIRAQIIDAGAPQTLSAVLSALAVESEEVLWAALFLLAVLLREASPLYVQHVLALARGGILRALRKAVGSYHARVASQELMEDEMISKAGQYLQDVFERAEKVLWLRRSHRVIQLLAWGMLALGAVHTLRRAWRSSQQRWHVSHSVRGR